MKFKILAALSLAGLVAAPGLAMADTEVFGQSEIGIEQALLQKGIHADRVEEWGQLLRVFVHDANGRTAMIYLDPDTLQQVQPV